MEKKMTGDISYPEQKIAKRNMEKELKNSFIEYSMSVITSRALPDVRDGMKPGQRRILYAMYEDRLTYDKPFRKSATTVGNVLGRYHPHGDAAVYQTMVRMAQPFSLRYPLIEGHGNFGNIDGDGAAAYRYTEARMAKLADQMMSDIEKNVVNFRPNFDNSRKEPEVLPSRFPNLLVNGSVGIAVGMATNIPPHNLSEVIDGIVYRMDHPDCSVSELMEFIKGPDFPTAGIIYGSRGMLDAYTTGKGRVLVRARAKIEEENRRIIVTEIPYAVNKSLLVEGIANLVNDKKIEGITDIRDESGRAGMRIVIEYRRDANAEVILNQLYKYSQLQETFAVNMLVLVGGEPRILSLPEILDQYITYQEGIIVRRTQFDLDRAQREMHIFEGYKIAIDHIEEIINTIRRSESISDAKAKMIEKFSLTDPQAQAIVEMPLGRLSGMERQKVEERILKLTAQVNDLKDILADIGRVREIVKSELYIMKDKFGDERRTELVEASDDIDIEDLIPRHTCVITTTESGYIKRQPADTYSAQNRGGKGMIGMKTKEEDYVDNVIITSSHSLLMFFTSAGRVYTKKAYRIPEASRTAKGSNIVNILELGENEKITSIISVDEFCENEYLVMVTKRGVIKKTRIMEYEYQRRSGKIALSLDEGDELLFVRRTDGNGELIIATRNGYAVKFREDTVRAMGRGARGVRGISLGEDDLVVGVALVEENKKLVTITEGGFGKQTEYEEFRLMMHRGGKGVKCHNITEKTGKLCAITSVEENDDLIMITNDGTIIRIPISGIPVYSRSAGGVIVMRLSEGSSIVNIARIAYEEPKADQPAEAVAVGEGEEASQPESADEVKEPIEEGKENEEA